MTIVATIEELYGNSHELTLLELRQHLETYACLGVDTRDTMGRITACKEIDWDVIHLIHEVEHLDTRSM